MISAKIRDRDRNFLRSGDPDLLRLRREEQQVELRKSKRCEIAAKRRALASLSSPSQFELPSQVCREKLPAPLSLLPESSLSPNHPANSALQFLRDGGKSDRLTGLSTLKHLLSSDTVPLVAIANLGSIQTLLGLVQSEEEEIVREATWCLTNLLSGPSEITRKVVDASGIWTLYHLFLHTNNGDIRDQAIWSLSNIAGDSVTYRDQVISTGIVTGLSDLLVTGKIRTNTSFELVTWFLSNVCRGQPAPHSTVIERVLQLVPGFLTMEKTGILGNTCWILSHLTANGDPGVIDTVLNSGIVGRLFELLMTYGESVQIPALRIIGNITVGDDSQTQVLLNLGLISHLAALITSAKRDIRREAVWCFSNITGGSEEQALAVAGHSVIHLIVKALGDSDFGVKKEAVWTIGNLTNYLENGVYEGLIQSGVLELLLQVLEHQDAEILSLALDAIARLIRAKQQAIRQFEELQGIHYLECLRDHSNITVHTKAGDLIREFTGRTDLLDRMDLQETGFDFS